MSGPVPSPSMNGMIGLLGNCSLPPLRVILAPPAGAVGVKLAMGSSRCWAMPRPCHWRGSKLRWNRLDKRTIVAVPGPEVKHQRSEEHTSELQSLMRISYAVFCLKKKKKDNKHNEHRHHKTARLD